MPTNRPKDRTESYLIAPESRIQEFPVVIPAPNVAGGMNTFLDSSNLDPSQYTSLQNVFIRTGRLSRRYGTSAITPTKPNSNQVMKFYGTQNYAGNILQFRFDSTTIYSRATLAWTQLTSSGGAPAPSGGLYDRWRVCTIDDRIFATNNGVNPLLELVIATDNYQPVGDAPSFKYIATVANRVIGANLTKPYGGGNPNPNWLGWSGDTNFTEWNTTVDVSAGFDILLDAIPARSDFITGLLGYESTLLVMRSESIVLGTLLQSATNPFYFYIAVPNIGCDSPDTLASTSYGCIWYDNKTRMVYEYMIGQQQPQPIGLPVAESIANQVVDNTKIFGSWDSLRQEYQLCITLGNSTNIWTYSKRTNTWWFDVIPLVSSVDSVQFSSSAVTINDLVGTIGAQVGTIGGFSSGINNQSRFYGLSSGDILMSDQSQTKDNNQVYSTIISSKNFENIEIDVYWKRIRFEFNVAVATNMGISFSKDNGNTWTLYKSVNLSPGNTRQIIICNKNVKSRQIMWQIVSNSGQWDLVRYEVFGTQGAPSRGLSTQT